MKIFKRIGAVACVLGAVGFGCSSAPNGMPGAPSWVHQPTRTVDSGYIVYVGTGEDYTAERASFKAEAAAIQDLANECSFAPKGTRIEDHYDYFNDGRHQSFAKVAVSFDDCDQAKQTLEPAKIQELANAQMTSELQRYQQMEYDMPEGQGAPSQSAPPNPMLAETDSQTSPSGGVPSAYYPSSGGGMAQPAVIQDDGVYFVERQQVAYAKEVVIMSPPSSYPPGSVQSQQFMTTVRPQTNQIQQYEQVHPAVRTWNKSWSSVERDPTTRLPPSIPRPRGYENGNAFRQSGYRQGQSGQRRGNGGNGRRRRRRYGDE